MSQIHQSLKHFRDLNSLGWGQTTYNMVGSRTGGVSYQNTTGRPIFVSIIGTGTWRKAQISVDNSVWKSVGAVAGEYERSTSFIVAPDEYYRVESGGANINFWAELRG